MVATFALGSNVRPLLNSFYYRSNQIWNGVINGNRNKPFFKMTTFGLGGGATAVSGYAWYQWRNYRSWNVHAEDNPKILSKNSSSSSSPLSKLSSSSSPITTTTAAATTITSSPTTIPSSSSPSTSKETKESKPTSRLSKDEWKDVANEINRMGHNMKQSLEWRWYDYVVFYLITASTLGLSLLFLPIWKYYFYKKHVASLKIGQLRCRLKSEFMDFFFEVFVYSSLLNVFTLGLYTLFGFSGQHESYWLDHNVEWYVDSNDFE